MLHIKELTYRLGSQLLLDNASVRIPTGHKVGLVGCNGAGKSTLLKLITGDLNSESGEITLSKNCRIGYVKQEAPRGCDSLIEWVLSADKERRALLAEAETAKDPKRIADIQLHLNSIDAHAAPSRASQILAGLGFDETAQNRACSTFSGGWRMRGALAAILFLQPELLLLDEPTNYLDLSGALWLENYLRTYPHTVLIVSHDRNFLNRAVSFILHLECARLSLYTGNYDDFEKKKCLQRQIDLGLKKKQDNERRRINAFIDRFRAKATKATQAKSRLKTLSRMKPIAVQVEDTVAKFSFRAPNKLIANPLLQLKNVAAGYKRDTPILDNLTLRINNDDRIALLGHNGSGKSTLAKLITGRLKPFNGHVIRHCNTKIGYFAQHQMDELESNLCPYDYITELMPDASETQRRAKFGAFGFGVEKVNNKCSSLSGGERARLLLIIAAFHSPHVFVLDEPTNHLDIKSRQALIQGLNDYRGAVILISHDRYLIESCAEYLWLVRDGSVFPFDGDMDDYCSFLTNTSQYNKYMKSKSPKILPQRKETRLEQRRIEAKCRAQLLPIKKILHSLESNIKIMITKIADIDTELSNGSLYTSNTKRAQQLSIERGRIKKELEQAEVEWVNTMENYENLTKN